MLWADSIYWCQQALALTPKIPENCGRRSLVHSSARLLAEVRRLLIDLFHACDKNICSGA
jgi:hypothetical protein